MPKRDVELELYSTISWGKPKSFETILNFLMSTGYDLNTPPSGKAMTFLYFAVYAQQKHSPTTNINFQIPFK